MEIVVVLLGLHFYAKEAYIVDSRLTILLGWQQERMTCL